MIFDDQHPDRTDDSSGKLVARLRLGGGLAERNPELDSGAGAGAAFDSAPSPGEFGALPDERQPQMTGAVFDVGWIIAHAVVDYPDQAAVLDVKELDRDGAGQGLLAYIAQGLPDGPVYQLGRAVRSAGAYPVIQPVGDPGLRVHLLQVNPQRGPQAAVFQARRLEVVNNLTQVA